MGRETHLRRINLGPVLSRFPPFRLGELLLLHLRSFDPRDVFGDGSLHESVVEDGEVLEAEMNAEGGGGVVVDHGGLERKEERKREKFKRRRQEKGGEDGVELTFMCVRGPGPREGNLEVAYLTETERMKGERTPSEPSRTTKRRGRKRRDDSRRSTMESPKNSSRWKWM